MPAGTAPRQYSRKSPRQTPSANTSDPAIAATAPITKPVRRPNRANTIPAGMEAHSVASIWIAMGRVARDLSSARL